MQDNLPAFSDAYFVAPGLVEVTDAALALAREFAGSSGVPSRWTVGFTFYSRSEIRAADGTLLEETGPGLDIGAFRPGVVPPEYLYRRDGFSFAIKLDPHLFAHGRAVIDVDPADPQAVIVRPLRD